MSAFSASTPPDPQPWGFWPTLGFGLLVGVVFVGVQTLVAWVYLAQQFSSQGIPSDPESLINDLQFNGQVLALATLATTPICTLLVILLAWLRRRLAVVSYLGLSPPGWGALGRWLLLTLLLVGATDGLRLLLNRPIVPEFAIRTFQSADLGLLVVALVIAAPLTEEFFFRGFLLPGWQSSWPGPVGALLLTSGFWAGIHLQYDLFDITLIFGVGILLGLARWRSGSLFTPLAMHALNNLLSVLQTLWVVGQIS
ncbi:MAG: CPBP family intramembrane metalloprotease [Synechococcaceae cyanobacterium SM2_3_1]|nr:CPBP family intramembrane metalloprotease [Synechococcaceae cyanobacterium SM2_3_1]